MDEIEQSKAALKEIHEFFKANIQNGTFRVDLKIVGGKRTPLRDIVKNYTQLTDWIWFTKILQPNFYCENSCTFL